MKKILLSSAFTIVFFLSSHSQVSKTTVGIKPIYSTNFKQYEQSVYDLVSSSFSESGRFDVVDRSKWSLLKEERELQKTEDFIDGKVADQGKSIGAQYIVVGNIGNVSSSQNRSYNSSNQLIISYSATVSFSLTVLNVETGQILNAQTFTSGSGFFTSPTQDLAISRAFGGLKNEIKKWIGKTFTVKSKVVKILAETDSKGVKSILIASGSAVGLRSGNDIRIVSYEDIEVDGKKISRTFDIAKGQITKVNDENFSECKVSSNGLEVKKFFSENKPLFVIVVE
jgi:hypothetical protein